MSTLWSSYRSGRIHAAEADKVYVPYGWRYDQSKYVLIWLHGAGADYKLGPVERLLAEILRVPIVACDMGGAVTYGSNTLTAPVTGRFATVSAWAEANLQTKPGKALIWGGSMGSYNGLQILKENPTKVAALGAALPVVDLEDVRANNRSAYTAEITAIHGAPVPDAKNPARNTATIQGADVQIKLWGSNTDTVGQWSDAQAFDAAVSNCTLVDIGAWGHSYLVMATGDYAQDVADFFEPHVA